MIIFFVFFLFEKEYVISAIISLVFALIFFFGLISYTERTNRDLSRFLQAVRYADFSQTFTSFGLGSSFEDLNKAFSDVMKDFRKNREEKEEQYRYLQTIVQHVDVGLITFDDSGQVHLINNAAKKLLNVHQLSNISTEKSFSDEFKKRVLALRAGHKTLITVINNDQQIQLAIRATEFKQKKQKFTLLSLQDIQGELEDKELEAWQMLIRVLTHEIMNSITPIASLSATTNDLIESMRQEENDHNDPEILDDVKMALHTIHKRSLGLTDFVQAYRNVTLIPKPQFTLVMIKDLFSRMERLMANRFSKNNIIFSMSVEPQSLELTLDQGLMEQVLINLLLNAFDAVLEREDPKIFLKALINDEGRTIIEVSDNGYGIDQEALSKIFIPFFTTKKNGSGIGLSFSRQVLRLHHGSIKVKSAPDQKTTVTLTFY